MNVLSNITRNDTRVIESVTLDNDERLVFTKANQKTELASVNTYKVRQSLTIPDYSLSNSWVQYPIDLHDILNGTGTYIILILYGAVIYSGIFSYVDETTANIDDEIYLHAGGCFTRNDITSGDNIEGRIYAKLALPSSHTSSFTGTPINEDGSYVDSDKNGTTPDKITTTIGHATLHPLLFLACSKVESNANTKVTIKFRKMI